MPITVGGTSITFNDSTTQNSGGSRSLSTSGWEKLPSGLIVQWGTNSYPAARFQAVSVTFPIAFPSTVYGVNVTPRSVVAEELGYLLTSSYRFLTRTGFTGYGTTFANEAAIDAITWMAWGV